MLLTLAARTFADRPYVRPGGDAPRNRTDLVFGLPEFAIEQLELRGLTLSADLLSGWGLPELDRLRDQADKAACPCLVLVDESPLKLASNRRDTRERAGERVRRLGVAAQRLGCNALGIRIEADASEDTEEQVAATIKDLMPSLERSEVNLLIMPGEGLTEDPDQLVSLIKRIGGFRIGSLPTFEHAAATGDAVATLRKLAPYAGAVHASIADFTKAGKHKGWDLAECVEAIKSVGFVNTLAIDLVGDADPMEVVPVAREQLAAAIEDEG